ncbi:MAG: hypothetical protein NW224_13185 [Leptolyngbyaceae cyanobacterium bins.302]|nr:hypothetical protein [Leptolyngbyaceae cyanobacterium bins.302]
MTYQPPSYHEMLDILDFVMQKHALVLTTQLKLSSEQAVSLAHTIAVDIQSLNPQQIQDIKSSIHPLTVSDIATQHHTIEGIRMVSDYFEECEKNEGSKNDSASAILASARLNLENYFCFVYLKESLFLALSNHLKKTNSGSALFRVSQFLLREEVRQLRNALAHASWIVDYSKANEFKYWDNGKEYTISDERWVLLRNLAYTISFVVINKL